MITNIIRHIKKHGLKQTYKDWKINFYKLQTPELINKQQIHGSIAMMLGLVLILCVFIKQRMYYAILAILAGLFMNYISLKTFLMQKKALEKLKDEFISIDEEVIE